MPRATQMDSKQALLHKPVHSNQSSFNRKLQITFKSKNGELHARKLNHGNRAFERVKSYMFLPSQVLKVNM